MNLYLDLSAEFMLRDTSVKFLGGFLHWMWLFLICILVLFLRSICGWICRAILSIKLHLDLHIVGFAAAFCQIC